VGDNHSSAVVRGGLMFAAAAGVVFFAGWFLFRQTRGASMNPYEYELDRFLEVPAALLSWNELEPMPAGVDEPAGLAVGPGERVYVAGADKVAVLEVGGGAPREFPLESPGRAIAVSPDGRVYVATRDHVDVYGADGSHESSWMGLGEDALITGIAAGESGVYVAEFASRLVWRFDASGRLVGQIGKPRPADGYQGFRLPSPYFDVALSPEGGLWIVNPGKLRVEKYSDDGELLLSWGEASMEISGFCGCCNPTHLAVAPDGRFITAEKGLPRVKAYRGDGTLESVVAGPSAFEPGAVGLDLAVDSAGRVLVLDPASKAVRIFSKRTDEAEKK